MCADTTSPLPRFASFEEYWAVRNDPAVWLPVLRQALKAARLANASPMEMLRPSQYPTALAPDLGVVVTAYPAQWGGLDSYHLEVEAHHVIEGHGLPVPGLIAHGTCPRRATLPEWAWLCETVAEGQPWSTAEPAMSRQLKEQAAAGVGACLRRFHAIPHAGGGGHLGAGWVAFLSLIRDEQAHLGEHDGRLARFPPALRPHLHALAASTLDGVDANAPTSLLHGDLHGDNVFIDPVAGALTGIIDLNEMYAGHQWYDLADASFRLLHGEPACVPKLLAGYGLNAEEPVDDIALRLLGWALLHDWDILTDTCHQRGTAQTNLADLACHLTGLHPHGSPRDSRP